MTKIEPRAKFKSLVKAMGSFLIGPKFNSNVNFNPNEMIPRTGSPMKIDRFSDILPYAYFDETDNLCAIAGPDFASFEGIGYVLEITPQIGATPVMAQSLMHLFGNGAPPGTGIQVSLFGSPWIRPLTDLIITSSAQPKETDSPERAEQLELMKKVSVSRAEFLLKGTHANPRPMMRSRLRNFRSWISVVIPEKNPMDSFAREKALALRESHMALLIQWHLSPWVWNEVALVNTVSQLLNPQNFLEENWFPSIPDSGREPRMQCVSHSTEIDIESDFIQFSSAEARKPVEAVAMSVRNYPDSINLSQMNELLGSPKGTGATYPCPFLITTIASISNYESQKSRAQIKSARAEQLAITEIARVIPAMRKEAEDWRLACESFETGEGLLRMTNQLLLFPTPEERFNASEAAKAIFRTTGLELSVDTFMQLQGLIGSLPMTAGPLLANDLKVAQRSTTKTAANAANMLPIIADWRGSPPAAGQEYPTPIINLVSRRGQILSVNPFANLNGNYNGAVIGASGSGKSVLLNEIASGMLRTGGRVWIIDNGRSYEKTCSVIGGQSIEFSDTPRADGSYDCLNPFSMIRDIDKDIHILLPVIAQMASPQLPLNTLLMSHLGTHFRDVWERFGQLGKIPTISNLADSLINNGRIGGSNPKLRNYAMSEAFDKLSPVEQAKLNDSRISDLGVQLAPFCKGGAYQTFFEGEANISFDNKFVVLELEQLKNKKDLQSVILMLLMCLIDLEMREGNRREAKLVIIDEAWDLMGEGHAGKFIEEGYRRARKYKGSFFTATQSPSDYWKSETARAALENSDCLFLLRQKPEVIEQLQRKGQLAMDQSQISMLSSLTTVAGVYSEVFVRIGDQPPAVCRLLLDPYSLLLMSAHTADIEGFNDYRNQGFPTDAAIQAVLK
ncbi:MAG: type IV secretion system protein TraC, partial [Burkholderiales bacterium]|nr:type IV secretion system protein TraC [Burkholderiales bacterium]